MNEACQDGFLNATDVADYLVRKGLPFRTAHGVSARAVRMAIDRGCRLEDLSIEDFKACSELIEKDIFEIIPPEACVNARKTDGGPAEEKVREQIAALRDFAGKIKK